MKTQIQLNIGQGQHVYAWGDHWAKLPQRETRSGRTHGVAVSVSGQVIVFREADPAVLFFDAQGQLIKSWGNRFLGAHGLTLVNEGGDEYLWLTDQYSGEVVKTNLEGKTLLKLDKPDLPVYYDGNFSPTGVAVCAERFGGNGDIWVADGYGKHQVHRYNKKGEYGQSLTGKEGSVGAFNCPHGLWIETRFSDPELYIADRGNHCVQVYDLEGKFKYSFGRDLVYSPCSFAAYEDFLVIPEIHARVAILDRNKKLVCYLGEDIPVVDHEAWPDLPQESVQPGKFVSPHAAAADHEGNLYIVEWMTGGRITKLEKAESRFL